MRKKGKRGRVEFVEVVRVEKSEVVRVEVG